MQFDLETATYHAYAVSNFHLNRKNGPDNYAFVHFLRPMVLYQNGKPVKLEKGAFIIFSHGYPQHYYPQTTDMLENWCHFNCSGFAEWLDELGIHMNHPFYLRDTTVADMIFKDISFHYHNNDIRAAGFSMQALFCCLAANRQTGNVKDPNLKRIYALRDQLRFRAEENWTLRSMAAEVNFSESYLNKLYRETFGISPKKDLFQMRMERAKYLLSNTSYSVEYIAHMLNYESSTSFISRFHRAVGVTPLQYRKQ